MVSRVCCVVVVGFRFALCCDRFVSRCGCLVLCYGARGLCWGLFVVCCLMRVNYVVLCGRV